MKYFTWKNRYVDPENQMIWGGNPQFPEGSEVDFSIGEEVKKEGLLTRFLLDWQPGASQTGYLTDYCPQMGLDGIVVTQNSVDVLLSTGIENMQVFDLEIIDEKHGKIYTEYKIVNVIGVLDAVDYERSEVKYSRKGRLMRYKKLVLDETKIPEDLLIFRLEKFKPTIIIHETVKKAIEDAGLTGFVIEPPDGISK